LDSFKTEYEFTLPRGYVTESGDLHKKGIMRLATAADEILPMKDPRVRQNPAYLPVILLARVVTTLGSVQQITPHIIENLYSTDFAYLQDLYQRLNDFSSQQFNVDCPNCKHQFGVEVPSLGEL